MLKWIGLSLFAGATLALATPAVASDLYGRADVNGAQVVPATAATATAFGRVTFSTGASAVISVEYSGLSGSCVAAHIHGPAAAGQSGPILFTFGACFSASGVIAQQFFPTAAQTLEGRAGLWYVDFHTAAFPDGEIRGQFLPESALTGVMQGAQVVPGHVTPAGGFAAVTIRTDRQEAIASVVYLNVAGGHTGLHVHGPALPGQTGPLVFTFSAGNPSTSGGASDFRFPITPAQADDMRRGLYYIDAHSAAFPEGEVRAQVKPTDRFVDFDADGRSEIGMFRNITGTWYAQNAASGATSITPFGMAADVPIQGDFDGDGQADQAIWRSGTFWVRLSSTGTVMTRNWGIAGDDPRASADYDADGVTDFAVFRPGAQGAFWILLSASQTVRVVPWGVNGDTSITGDFDGDRKADVAIYRSSTNTYWVLQSTNGPAAQPWGVFATDWITPGDYDGDGKTDFAVMRVGGPDAGTWFILQSSTGTFVPKFLGIATDVATPGDYDGDGKTDIAVWRSSGTPMYFIVPSSTGVLQIVPFGLLGDVIFSFYVIR